MHLVHAALAVLQCIKVTGSTAWRAWTHLVVAVLVPLNNRAESTARHGYCITKGAASSKDCNTELAARDCIAKGAATARIVIQNPQQAARDCITKGAATSKDCNTVPAASCKRLYYRAYSKQQDIVIQHPQQLLGKYHIPFVDFAGTLCTIVTGLTEPTP